MFQFPEINLLPDDDKPKSVRNWRIRQALIACSAWAMMVFLTIPALFGVPYELPRAGMVAWASDLESTKTDFQKTVASFKSSLEDTQALVLEGLIIDAQRGWCEAKRSKTPPGIYALRVRDLKKKYEDSIGKVPEIPDCDRV